MKQINYVYNPYPEGFIKIYDFTLKWIYKNIPKNSKIIDIGCNNGLLTSIIYKKCSPSKIIGIDKDSNQIITAQKKHNEIEFVFLDGENTCELKKLGKFDVIFLRNTFHHFEKKNETLNFYKNEMLNTNGRILIIDLDSKSNFSLWGFGAFITTLFSIRTIGISEFINIIINTHLLQKKEIRIHRQSDKVLLKKQKWLHLKDIKKNFKEVFDSYYFYKKSYLFGYGGIYFFEYKLNNMNDGIKFNNLTFAYKNGSKVNSIFFKFKGLMETNSISVILGRSGTGKSTLFNLICNILKPIADNENQILIYNLPPYKAIKEQYLAYLPQFFQPAHWLTVRENISLSLRFSGFNSTKRQIIASQILKDLKLENICDKKADELSGGQKRKVSLAMLLSTKAKVFLLDEPFSNLDTYSKFEIYEFLINNWQNFTHPELEIDTKNTFIVTHDLEEAVLLGEAVYILGSKLPQNEFVKIENPIIKKRENMELDKIRYTEEFNDFIEIIKNQLNN